MRKMVLLFAVLGVVSGACQYAYAARTLIECDGGEAWAEGALTRLEEMDSDQRAANAVLQSSTYLELETPDDLVWLRDEMQPYVARAKARYRQQLDEATPWCLRRIQELTTDVFYYDWKTYEAVSHGDEERVAKLQEQSLAAGDAVSREYDRLVEKYHWVK